MAAVLPAGGLTLAFVLLPFVVRGRSGLSVAQQRVIAVLVGLMFLSGCGGGGSGGSPGGNTGAGGGSGSATSSGTPAGTYAITITATSGATSASTVYNLTVN
jgi:hypothetical protein